MIEGFVYSGKGRLTTAELEAPISATDHPFLRAHQQALEGRNAAGPSRLHESLNISRPHRIHRAPEGQTSRTRSKSEVTHRRNEKK